jgi:hypothetical protein
MRIYLWCWLRRSYRRGGSWANNWCWSRVLYWNGDRCSWSSKQSRSWSSQRRKSSWRSRMSVYQNLSCPASIFPLPLLIIPWDSPHIFLQSHNLRLTILIHLECHGVIPPRIAVLQIGLPLDLSPLRISPSYLLPCNSSAGVSQSSSKVPSTKK